GGDRVVNVGSISIGDKVTCQVDGKRRMAIGRNHTATHLLHSALRKLIGEHALQAGSEVTPDRLRFDFSHFQAVTKEEIKKLEEMVNSMILADAPTEIMLTNLDEARKMGATALFGEKYGESVRVVRMGDLSTELCGGTHLCHTSQVGLFKIISESSIGAGLRRIEAVTGEAALQYVNDIEEKLQKTAEIIGSSVGEVISTAERVMQNLKQAQKELSQQKAKGAANTAGELASKAEEVNGVKFVTAKLPISDVPLLQTTVDTIADKLGSGVVVIAGCSNEKLVFIGKVTQDLVKKGFHAGNILKETAKVAGGGGGGRPDFAQAGGKDIEKADSALEKAVEIIRNQASEN
ncbi:MAG: DHHA1 domain-containing protein, partial [Armatimonadota bacterium]